MTQKIIDPRVFGAISDKDKGRPKFHLPPAQYDDWVAKGIVTPETAVRVEPMPTETEFNK